MVLQAEQGECGLACLVMILGFLGNETDIQTLRRKYSVSVQGLTLKTLMQHADRMQLISRPLRLELEDIAKIRTPAILHWDMNHFVVLKKVQGRKITIHDPALGKKIYSYHEVGKHFSGIALEITAGKMFIPKREQSNLRFTDLWKNTDGLFGSLAHIFVLSLVLQIFVLSLPFYTQIFVDDVLVNFDLDLLKIIAAGFLFITLLKCISEWVRSQVVLHLSSKLSLQFGSHICFHLYQLPLEYFNKRHVGDIVSRFSSIRQLKDYLCSGIVEILVDGLMVLTTLVLMFVYSKELTFIALAGVLLYALFRYCFFNSFYQFNEQVLKDGAAENTRFIENLKSIQSIKIFGKELDRLRAWQHDYADWINSGIRIEKLGISAKFINNLLQGGENILLVLVGGYAVINRELSIGMLIAYLSFKDQFYTRVFALLDSLFEFKLLDVHLHRLADIVLHEREDQPEKPVFLPAFRSQDPCLQLKGLGFSYSADTSRLFRNINLDVAANETIAIIGPSGCGKSSLLKIMMGFYKPSEGNIIFCGRNLNSLDKSTYRESATAVLQDDGLLSGSILQNITFFDANPDIELAEHCAQLASISHEIVNMPMQYDTWVGNMGSALSGGQIQRILLARAFYHKPRLLLLDEACSHLDIQTEIKINNAIRDMKIARVIVAHRPQSIVHADNIYMLTGNGLKKLTRDEVQVLLSLKREAAPDIAA